ncbi:MAG: hypothetical protein GX868_16000 [Actinobacteria bacterium]|nr:hypothetical protein [Actinomycetota bacterium]
MSDATPESGQAPLGDGVYDVFIVDATPDPSDDSRVVSVDLTVTSGAHKGFTFTLAAGGLQGTDIDLMGMPATLTVSGGLPSLTLD